MGDNEFCRCCVAYFVNSYRNWQMDGRIMQVRHEIEINLNKKLDEGRVFCLHISLDNGL